MLAIRETAPFSDWHADLRDPQATVRIDARIRSLSLGNPGDVNPGGDGVSEMRIDYGPDYPVHFIQCRAGIVILVCAGNKRTEVKDIKPAKALARQE